MLPYVFPHQHAGKGLWVAAKDSLYLQAIAEKAAERINQNGWGAWYLRPRGQSPAGIASILYALIAPAPWTMIPINAFFHALGGIALYYILLLVTGSRSASAVAAGVVISMPSTLLWTSQLHRDGTFVAGNLLFICGWAYLWTWCRKGQWLPAFRFLLLLLLGATVAWVGRPYSLKFTIVTSGSICFSYCVLLIHGLAQQREKMRPQATGVAIVLLALAGNVGLSHVLWTGGYNMPLSPVGDGGSSSSHAVSIYTGLPESIKVDSAPGVNPGSQAIRDAVAWRRTMWLPGFVDRACLNLAVIRCYGLMMKGNMCVDEDVKITSVGGIVLHLPRALQLALLSPFPQHWYDSSLPFSSQLMRIGSGFEMLVLVYPGLLFWWYGFACRRLRPGVWVLLVCCMIPLLTYGVSVVNIGSLYRIRYSFLMPLVGVGLAYCFSRYLFADEDTISSAD